MEITKGISRKIKKGINMSKQTAVNWLIDKIYFERVEVNRELLDQAIKIEKKQNFKTWNNALEELQDLQDATKLSNERGSPPLTMAIK